MLGEYPLGEASKRLLLGQDLRRVRLHEQRERLYIAETSWWTYKSIVSDASHPSAPTETRKEALPRDISSAPGVHDPGDTRCGVALSRPAVHNSSASPVWNANASGGIEAFLTSPPRVWMYSPASGLGDGTSSTTSEGEDADEVWCFRYMAEQRPVSMLSEQQQIPVASQV